MFQRTMLRTGLESVAGFWPPCPGSSSSSPSPSASASASRFLSSQYLSTVWTPYPHCNIMAHCPRLRFKVHIVPILITLLLWVGSRIRARSHIPSVTFCPLYSVLITFQLWGGSRIWVCDHIPSDFIFPHVFWNQNLKALLSPYFQGGSRIRARSHIPSWSTSSRRFKGARQVDFTLRYFNDD